MSTPRFSRDCVRFAPMVTAREGELEPAEVAERDAHLAGCARCRAEAADFAATDGLIRDALLGEAVHRDFAPFVDGVLARVERQPVPARTREARPAEAPARGGFWDAVVGWVRHHRFAAVTGAIAPAVAGIALIMYVAAVRPSGSQPAEALVVADAGSSLVLQTAEGPVVLLGDSDDGGT